jgi:hypothetical protein
MVKGGVVVGVVVQDESVPCLCRRLSRPRMRIVGLSLARSLALARGYSTLVCLLRLAIAMHMHISHHIISFFHQNPARYQSNLSTAFSHLRG